MYNTNRIELVDECYATYVRCRGKSKRIKITLNGPGKTNVVRDLGAPPILIYLPPSMMQKM